MSVSNVTSVDSYFSIRLDQISDTLLYIGEGNLGADETAPVWSIKKMEQIGSIWKLTYADGNQNKDNVWSDRLTLSYL